MFNIHYNRSGGGCKWREAGFLTSSPDEVIFDLFACRISFSLSPAERQTKVRPTKLFYRHSELVRTHWACYDRRRVMDRAASEEVAF